MIECPACNGVWLEPQDLEQMAREAACSPGPVAGPAGAAAPSHPMAYLPCVRCGQLMQRRQFRWAERSSRVVLDHCGDHGVWLDGGELEAVLAHARAIGPGSGSVADTAPRVGPTASIAPGPDAARPGSGRRGGLLGALLESVREMFTDEIL